MLPKNPIDKWNKTSRVAQIMACAIGLPLAAALLILLSAALLLLWIPATLWLLWNSITKLQKKSTAQEVEVVSP